MNYLGSLIVRTIRDEEDSFWILVNLFESILPLDYYSLMTDIIVDQRVFIKIFKKKKAKLYKHFEYIELDLGLICFPWLVCLLTANLHRDICETIFDFIFLEGNVVIFKAIFAILSILEPYLLKAENFQQANDILEHQMKNLITDPEIMIKHMAKYGGLKSDLINHLRSNTRKSVLKEQEKIWIGNSRDGCPTPSDTPVYKRVKLLSKFFLLNKAMRRYTNQSVVEMDDTSLKLTGKSHCNNNWPLCLYDFTLKSRIVNYFVFRVSKPVKVIQDYFGDSSEEEKSYSRSGMNQTEYLFIPSDKKKFKICGEIDENGQERVEIDTIVHPLIFQDEDLDANLLMCRESHSCVHKGFEPYFQKLFDEENDILFQNWTVHCSYGDEIASSKYFDQFVYEILSFQEIERINTPNEKPDEPRAKSLFNRLQSVRMSGQSFETLRPELNSGSGNTLEVPIAPSRSLGLKKCGSLCIPECAVERNILEIAYGVAKSNRADDEEEDDILFQEES